MWALADQIEEAGGHMWESIKAGECVLLECPGRWYLGVVARRDNATVCLEEAVCLHLISDLALFLSGQLAPGSEATPLPSGIEINLASVDSALPFPVRKLAAVRRRTHPPKETGA